MSVTIKYGKWNFRQVVGSLIYLMAGTRYDITFATTKLAKFSHNPGERHFEALFWTLGYIKGNPNFGIRFYHDPKASPIGELLSRNNVDLRRIVTFADSSWQDDKDTGRSTGSFAIFCQGGLVDYSSFVPDPVAMSSGEAEYNTCAVACMSSAHNRNIDSDFEYLGSSKENDHDYVIAGGKNWAPTPILLDSSAAVAMAETAQSTKRTRHIDRRFHYVRQGQATGKHQIKWISNTDQIADLGTKAVTSSVLEPLRDLLFVKVQD